MKLLGIIGGPEIIIILIVILILFGGKKIPELMRGLGKGVREYKNAMNGVDQDEDKSQKPSSQSGNNSTQQATDNAHQTTDEDSSQTD
ncbi:MAG: twin-arginine translocase TatA/TatE family subunit [Bacteroidales bacterium]|nr:twin-arginine translocase TatA/TatE family subunit [Bacteroidales bacterium]